MHVAAEPSWQALKDEELLTIRICDLGVRIEHSELEARIDQFYGELAARGVLFRLSQPGPRSKRDSASLCWCSCSTVRRLAG